MQVVLLISITLRSSPVFWAKNVRVGLFVMTWCVGATRGVGAL